MAVLWPATLPQQPSGYSQKAKPNTVRTQTDAGPTKVRRRFTKSVQEGQMDFLLTIAQRQILEDFFHNDLEDGVIAMTFVHPWKYTPVDMYVTDAPSYSADGPLGVRASFPVEFF
jgi:hypothetical protein